MMTVAVLFGGRSEEHDVSRRSAASVFEQLDRTKYKVLAIGIDRDGRWYPDLDAAVSDDSELGRVLSVNRKGNWSINHFPDEGKLVLFDRETETELKADIVFPVIHGTFCEDGTLQGLLELMSVPYVGSGVAGSAIGMDKDISKKLLNEAQINVVPWITVMRYEWESQKDFIIEEIKMEYGFPCFVKPANAGSSVGITKVMNEEDIVPAVHLAFEHDSKLIIEKAVNCREIECAVIGNADPRCSMPGEVIPDEDFYSYEAKYSGASQTKLEIPALLEDEIRDEIQHQAIKVYKTLSLHGMARIDFFIDTESGAIFLNEVNTLPGFTSISMYPKLWEESGIIYPDLLDHLIDLALQRYAGRGAISHNH